MTPIRPFQVIALVGLGLLQAGCGSVPRIDAALPATGPAAVLVPLGPVLAAADAASAGARITPRTAAALDARLGRLRARAGALRRPVVDEPTRGRMAQAAARAVAAR